MNFCVLKRFFLLGYLTANKKYNKNVQVLIILKKIKFSATFAILHFFIPSMKVISNCVNFFQFKFIPFSAVPFIHRVRISDQFS
jgi:hypothetical protein